MNKLVKVYTGNLQLGMYISQLDRPWLETPFLLQGFYVKDSEDIDLISGICDYVYVDVDGSVNAINITSNMSTVSSAVGFNSGITEFSVSIATNGDDQSSTKDEGGNSKNGETNLDRLFPGKKLETYTDTTNWKSEEPAAEQAILSLHDGLREVLSRNLNGGPLELLKIKQAVEPMVDSVIRCPGACIWLVSKKQQDKYIHQHSLATSIWAVALGRQLGLPKIDLRSLALGGLLFDIGKLKLGENLPKANRPLTDEESRIMKMHVEVGVKLLEEGGMKNQIVIDMVAHHHERHDGTGYPQGLAGNKIPVFARIAAIVDCYDAITSDRIYSSAISPPLAIKQLYEWKDTYFQAEIVDQFIQAVGIFPAGTLVELSSGEVAIVVAASPSQRLRPDLMLLLDSNKQPLGNMEFLDLKEVTQTEDGTSLFIVKSLEPNTYGISSTRQ
jgi:putative nucleotidyltransferase with HDIG domain